MLEYQKRHELPVKGVVDKRTATLINKEVERLHPKTGRKSQPFVVRGHVKQADGTPLADVAVLAVDQDLRGEQELGRTNSDKDGCYEIRKTAGQRKVIPI